MLLNAMGTNKTGTEKVSIGKVPGDISKSNSRGDGVEGKGVWYYLPSFLNRVENDGYGILLT